MMEITIEMETIICANCGIPFCVSEKTKNELVEHKKDFYCPNGHSQHYISETDADKYKKLYEDEKKKKEECLAKLPTIKKRGRPRKNGTN